MPHTARQLEYVAAVDMQADRRHVTQTLGDVHGVSHHRQNRAACERDFARLAQFSILTAIQRVFFFARKQKNRRPRSMIMRRRAASGGEANLQ